MIIKTDPKKIIQRENDQIFIYTYQGDIESAILICNTSPNEYKEKFTIKSKNLQLPEENPFVTAIKSGEDSLIRMQKVNANLEGNFEIEFGSAFVY